MRAIELARQVMEMVEVIDMVAGDRVVVNMTDLRQDNDEGLTNGEEQ